MKEAIKKIKDLADALHESADTKKGGGYLIIAAEPVEDDNPGAGFVSSINGQGMELLAMISFACKQNPSLLRLLKHAILTTEILPDNIAAESSEKPDHTAARESRNVIS